MRQNNNLSVTAFSSVVILLLLLSARSRGDHHSRVERGEKPIEGKSVTIQMPGAKPTGSDSYFCTSFNLAALAPDDPVMFVTKFEPVAAASERAHHLLLYTCEQPNPEKIWDCRHHQVCAGGKNGIIFAWAKNAPAKEMPEGVGFQLGHADPKNLVMQVHYVNELADEDFTGLRLHYQTEPTRYTAGIFLLFRYGLSIPPNSPVVHGDMNCRVSTSSILHPFAFRTHAHALGVVITGYKYNPTTKVFKEIARGNPQWPQAFYPMKEVESVEDGEYLVARCTYNSTGVDHVTSIGATAGDEMCNLYLMYYLENGQTTYQNCGDTQDDQITAILPADSDQPLPPNPLLEHHASHSHGPDHVTDPLKEAEMLEEEAAKRRKGDLDNPVNTVGLPTLDLTMPGAEPKMDDEYFCTAFEVKKLTGGKKVYVTDFEAKATALKAHHLILQKCDKPVKEEGQIWNCRHHSTCKGQTKIMFAWAKDAPPTHMPTDVGFRVSPEDGYLVLQVHYAHGLPDKDFTGLRLTYQENRPSNIAGIYLMLRSYLTIPAHAPRVHGDMNCRVDTPLTLFAFRTHAHSLGAVITGYAIKDGAWREVARGDPQKPQTFYPMTKFEAVDRGDYMAARCTFNATGSDHAVHIGATAGDEMCNLYVMYYTPSESDDFRICVDEELQSLAQNFPQDSDQTMAELHKEQPLSYGNGKGTSVIVPQKDKKQGGYLHNRQLPYNVPMPMPQNPYGGGGNVAYGYPNLYPPNQMNPYQMQQQQQLQMAYPMGFANDNNMFANPGSDGGGAGGGGGNNFYDGGGRDNVNDRQQQQQQQGAEKQQDQEQEEEVQEEPQKSPKKEVRTTTKVPIKWRTQSIHEVKDGGREGKTAQGSDLFPVPNWPPQETADKFGQISGVAIDMYGNPVIFHRGDRFWDSGSFKSNNEYNGDRNKPIPVDTVLTLNSTGHIVNSWGSGLFFMPHMVTIDSKNNVWLTDVALHQVFKFAPYGGVKKVPLISLGERFVPGSDDKHYCKPTSVAVASDGETFFVADGYCNSRIIKYRVQVDPSTGFHTVTQLLHWGEANGAGLSSSLSPNAFNVPHSLTLAEDKKVICVADRENSRVQCFNSEDGTFVRTLQPKGMGRVYSVAYSKADGGSIYALNGPDPFSIVTGIKTEGLIVDIQTGQIRSTFNGDGNGFENPHDVAVTADGNTLYEVELRPFRVWKLTNGKSSPSSSSQPSNLVPSSKTEDSGLAKIDFIGMLPSSTWGISIAVGSILLTCCISLCLACRRCRKRGKGTMSRNNGTTTKSKKRKDGKLDLGDFLGRSKDGFQPLKTEEEEDEAANISSDSDDLEEFSVPALRA